MAFDNKRVMLDTSFLIHLLDGRSALHSNAVGYFNYLLSQNYLPIVSTIAVAEICTIGDIKHLPLQNFVMCPFNVNHATTAGTLLKTAHKTKARRSLKNYKIVPNEVKMLAQAQCEGVQYFATADATVKELFLRYKKQKKVSFQLLDINTSHSTAFGVIVFPD